MVTGGSLRLEDRLFYQLSIEGTQGGEPSPKGDAGRWSHDEPTIKFTTLSGLDFSFTGQHASGVITIDLNNIQHSGPHFAFIRRGLPAYVLRFRKQ